MSASPPERFEVRPRRVTMVGLLFGCAVFGASGVVMIRLGLSGEYVEGPMLVVFGVLGVVFCVCGAVLPLKRLLSRKPVLVLSGAGLGVHTLGDGVVIPWDQVEEIGVLNAESVETAGVRVSDPELVPADLAWALTAPGGRTGEGARQLFVAFSRMVFGQRREFDGAQDLPAGLPRMVFNRRHYGYDFLFGPELRHHRPGRFAALLDHYCETATGESVIYYHEGV